MNSFPPSNSPLSPETRAALQRERELLHKRLQEIDAQLKRMEMIHPTNPDEPHDSGGDDLYLNDAPPAVLMHFAGVPTQRR